MFQADLVKALFAGMTSVGGASLRTKVLREFSQQETTSMDRIVRIIDHIHITNLGRLLKMSLQA
jgi:hypothetical protein